MCGRRVPERDIAVLRINVEDLCTENEIGEELSLTICYDCAPKLAIAIKEGIVKAEKQVRSDLLRVLINLGEV
jgi:hypothetical protein